MRNKHYHTIQTHAGFTLLEILIALFIFSIISLMLVGALHTVINAQSGTEKIAERLRVLQMVLLLMSRDIEQAVDRPILNASGSEESSFIGHADNFTLTHTGFADPMGTLTRSSLERTGYTWNEDALWRKTWRVLDQAPQSQPHSRKLMSDISEVSFQYLDQEGKFHTDWPVQGQSKESLPRAIRIRFTISKWGTLSQLYVISAQSSKNTQTPPKP